MYVVEELQDENLAPPVTVIKEIKDGEIIEVTTETDHLDPSVIHQFEDVATLEELSDLWESMDIPSRHAFAHLKDAAKERFQNA